MKKLKNKILILILIVAFALGITCIGSFASANTTPGWNFDMNPNSSQESSGYIEVNKADNTVAKVYYQAKRTTSCNANHTLDDDHKLPENNKESLETLVNQMQKGKFHTGSECYQYINKIEIESGVHKITKKISGYIEMSGGTLTIDETDEKVQGERAYYVEGSKDGTGVLNIIGLTDKEKRTTVYVKGDFKAINVDNADLVDVEGEDDQKGKIHVNLKNEEGTALTAKNGANVNMQYGGTIKSYSASGSLYGINLDGKNTVVKLKGFDVDVVGSSDNVEGAHVTAGTKFYYYSGTMSASGNKGATAVEVNGSDGNPGYFYLGDVKSYDKDCFPKLISSGQSSNTVYVSKNGVATLNGGNVYGKGEGSHAIYVNGGGKLNVNAGDKYATDTYDNPTTYSDINIYVDDADCAETVYINDGGKFEIRGKGAMFYRVGQYENIMIPASECKKPVFYIFRTETAGTYPLSGGTFVGKLFIEYGNVSDMILYNHYVRHEESNTKFNLVDSNDKIISGTPTKNDQFKTWNNDTVFAYSDGTRGILANGMTGKNSIGGTNAKYTNSLNGIYSIVDAEWELRQAMAASSRAEAEFNELDGGKADYIKEYQIPQGIVRGAIEVDGTGTNITNKDVSDCITLDINKVVLDVNKKDLLAQSTNIWGCGKAKGDIDVINLPKDYSGNPKYDADSDVHKLTLGGRSIYYTGRDWNNANIVVNVNETENLDPEKADYAKKGAASPIKRDELCMINLDGNLIIQDTLKNGQQLNINNTADVDAMGKIKYSAAKPDSAIIFAKSGDLTIESGLFYDTANVTGAYNGTAYGIESDSKYTGTVTIDAKSKDAVLDNNRVIILTGTDATGADSAEIKLLGGNLVVNAGIIGNYNKVETAASSNVFLGSKYGIYYNNAAIDNFASTNLKVNGGYISGNGTDGTGILLYDGIGTIYGGHISGTPKTALGDTVPRTGIATLSTYDTLGTSILVGDKAKKATVDPKLFLKSTSSDSDFIGDVYAYGKAKVAFAADSSMQKVIDDISSAADFDELSAKAANNTATTVIYGDLVLDGGINNTTSPFAHVDKTKILARIMGGEIKGEIISKDYTDLDVFNGNLATQTSDNDNDASDDIFKVLGNSDVDFYGTTSSCATVAGKVEIDSKDATINIGIDGATQADPWKGEYAIFTSNDTDGTDDVDFRIKNGTVEIVDASVAGDIEVSDLLTAKLYIYKGEYNTVNVRAKENAGSDKETNAELSKRVQLHGGKYTTLTVTNTDGDDTDENATDTHKVGDIIPGKVDADNVLIVDGVTYAKYYDQDNSRFYTNRYNHYVTINGVVKTDEQLDCVDVLLNKNVSDGQMNMETKVASYTARNNQGEVVEHGIEIHNQIDELKEFMTGSSNKSLTLYADVALNNVVDTIESGVNKNGICMNHFKDNTDTIDSIKITGGNKELYLNGNDIIGKNVEGLIQINGGSLKIYNGKQSATNSEKEKTVDNDYLGRIFNYTANGSTANVKAGELILRSGTLRGIDNVVNVAAGAKFTGLGGVVTTTWTKKDDLRNNSSYWKTDVKSESTPKDGNFNLNGTAIKANASSTVNLNSTKVYASYKAIANEGTLNVTGGDIHGGYYNGALKDSEYTGQSGCYKGLIKENEYAGDDYDKAIGLDTTKGTVNLTGGKVYGTEKGVILSGDVTNSKLYVSNTNIYGSLYGIEQNGGTIEAISGGTISGANSGHNSVGYIQNGGAVTSITGGLFSGTKYGFERTMQRDYSTNFLSAVGSPKEGAVFTGINLADGTLKDMFKLSGTDTNQYLEYTFRDANKVYMGTDVLGLSELKTGTTLNDKTFKTRNTDGSEASMAVTGQAAAANFTVAPRDYYEIYVTDPGDNSGKVHTSIAVNNDTTSKKDAVYSSYYNTVFVRSGAKPKIVLTPDADYALQEVAISDKQYFKDGFTGYTTNYSQNQRNDLRVGKVENLKADKASITPVNYEWAYSNGVVRDQYLSFISTEAVKMNVTTSFNGKLPAELAESAGGNVKVQYKLTKDSGEFVNYKDSYKPGIVEPDTNGDIYFAKGNYAQLQVNAYSGNAIHSCVLDTNNLIGDDLIKSTNNLVIAHIDGSGIYNFQANDNMALKTEFCELTDGSGIDATPRVVISNNDITEKEKYTAGTVDVLTPDYLDYVKINNENVTGETEKQNIIYLNNDAAAVALTWTIKGQKHVQINWSSSNNIVNFDSNTTEVFKDEDGNAGGYLNISPIAGKSGITKLTGIVQDGTDEKVVVYVKVNTLVPDKKTPSDGGATFTIVSKDTNATVSKGSNIETGEKITVTVKEGYLPKAVNTSKNKEIELTKAGDNQYTFKMPASKVEISTVVDPNYVPAQKEKDPNSKLNPTFEPKDVEAGYDMACQMIDVDESLWFHDSVNYVLYNGLMNGIAVNEFAPNMNTSRAMVITVLARMNGVKTITGENWYAPCVKWGVENGITDGSNPESDISRQEIVTMLYRYAQAINKGENGTIAAPNFKDKNDISSWAQESVDWACSVGIINGIENADKSVSFLPQKNATRAEVATMLTKFCENVLK